MKIVIIGASSAIARALALEAGKQDELILAGRDLDDLEDSAADIALQRSASTHALEFDIGKRDQHELFMQQCKSMLGHIDAIFFCHGQMFDQAQAERDPEAAASMLDINYTATVLLANRMVEHMRERDTGVLCFVSSVAGDRGRQSNFIYGSSKAALNTYVTGLQHRLVPCNVHALLVKPGFVDTAMTWGVPGMFLVASPEKVAADIWRAIRKRKHVLYTPWFWWIIMTIIKAVPRFVFHKSKL